ncbi:cytidine and deoxycytidylate deaminase zinc-binding domain-containing protein [Hirsutella rhossiliensis]|uniref:Cytidine and deoxycytidylate deaminase zinc-binding domain-containing protein n=1 Tax=Hirsutella rhossiliensis TaxID=111463 RepID=A0A9P8MU02_9HYPO|nr:cytidine and deoxycytidylate deaminase zinc-binding domain-containing protein [Hirsutella rhossiliensis]KAH0960191.1 cytidine and deoxycytidylate deaminase zinc-binding domain-containing protein [Hirsutella rhossiliensis]
MLSSLLGVVENSIVPVTRHGVASGSPLFGAAILSRSNLSVLTVATNNGRVSPLLHGELNCIQQFYTSTFPDPSCRPDPRNDTIFLATHEPCSLCLSAIAWAGFGEFYYLFKYEETRDLFGFPDDINILEEVFRVRGNDTEEQVQQRELYNAENKFFKGMSIADMVQETDEGERDRLAEEMKRVKGLYDDLHATFLTEKDRLQKDQADAPKPSNCSLPA